MLPHLKNQKFLPTLLLAFFYLILDFIDALILVPLFFAIIPIFLNVTPLLPESMAIFALYLARIEWVVINFVLLPFILVMKNKFIQRKFFAKHQVTPLYLIFFAILGTVLAIYWWYSLMLSIH